MICARSNDSKAKMMRFFGDPSIPLVSGVGSSSKVAKFLLGIPVQAATTSATTQGQSSQRTSSTIDSDSLEETGSEESRHGHLYALETSLLSENGTLAREGDSSIMSFSTTRRHEAPFFLPRQSQSDLEASECHPQLLLFETLNLISEAYWIPSTDSMEADPNLMFVRPLPSLTANIHSSVRKLSRVLGPDANLDVSIREIKACTHLYERLLLLLESRLPLCYFLLFLIHEQRGFEELFFVSDVLAFEQTLFLSTQSQVEKSQTIFAKYFTSPTTKNRLNTMTVPASLLRLVIAGIQNGARSCFAPVQSRAFCDLAYQLAKFKQSALWNTMDSDIGLCMIPTAGLTEKVKVLLRGAITEAQGFDSYASLCGISTTEFKLRLTQAAVEFVTERFQ
ncbi:hypothetical protein BCR33DRAFT_850075 [Rhizoclosmatium globosum]|uniref:Uncharacterized protein n=1 Tax=Rhizoclosmatium globosum TaxID=329046 RepID=A0A1Y2CDQ6_9FUNG|nr:hypothetical protein BCR33DRAFT_850075 [Rhizoclosmatium globosum]|eukprot:ORY45200.1 hypothetical protein BCR33DRAFT_850075 [Rhizoclosmatium globosum]